MHLILQCCGAQRPGKLTLCSRHLGSRSSRRNSPLRRSGECLATCDDPKLTLFGMSHGVIRPHLGNLHENEMKGNQARAPSGESSEACMCVFICPAAIFSEPYLRCGSRVDQREFSNGFVRRLTVAGTSWYLLVCVQCMGVLVFFA